MQHRDIPLGEVHRLHNWEVATISERDALLITSADIGKVALVGDVYYRLKDNSPLSWLPIGSGTFDHGQLTGLGDDSHPQYLNTTRGDLRYQLVDPDIVIDPAYVHTDSNFTAAEKTKLAGLSQYTHPVGDGNLHVPATGTSSNGKVLTAGATAGTFFWANPVTGVTDHTLLSNIGTMTHQELETALGTKEVLANKGIANGYAGLDSTGKVPAYQLPSFVDDILEYNDLASFPGTGESGKLYVAKDTGRVYRWSGSLYTAIASGAVDSVAGKIGNVILDKNDVGLSNLTNVAQLPATQTLQMSGDVTSGVSALANGTIATTLSNTGVTAGTYGSSSAVPVLTVDGKGRITNVTTLAVSGGGTGGASNLVDLGDCNISAPAANQILKYSGGKWTNTALNVTLGTDTAGDYVSSVTAGTGISIGGTTGEGWVPTISLTNIGTAGTYTKVTTDAQGRVTNGTTLSSSDIPNLDASKITSGTIDPARLPGFVDDVVEYATLASFPGTGESGKLYIALNTNKVYRWSGSVYVEIAASGSSVTSVAGRTGDVVLTKADVSLGSVDNTADADKAVFSATRLATARTITLTGDATGSASFDGSGNISINTTVTGGGGTSSYADTAGVLATPRTIQTNLGSTTAVSFDGSTNVTPGITGILPVANGGTGATNLSGLVKGNGTSAMTVATSGVDYVVPSGSITGNAGTATKLATPRTINGVEFDGSANITISAGGGSEEILGTAIASAATTSIGGSGFNTVHITGTTTITSLGTAASNGIRRIVIFDGALILTHNATSLILPTGANITTAAGDKAEFICENGVSGYWTCVMYTRANGYPLTLGNLSTTGSAATLTTARTISGVSFNGSANINIEDRLGTAIASAATITIGTAGLGDYIHITGTTTITSLGTAGAAGIRRTLIFDGALTLTHNATSLICPGAANIVTVAGTIIEVVAETTANWRVVSITHPNLAFTELSYLDGVTSAIQTQINSKQATLVSGTNIKTINGTTILGSGDLVVSGGGGVTLSDGITTGTYYPAMANAVSGTMSTGYLKSTALNYTADTGTLNSTNFNSTSDKRKKKDIVTIDSGVNIIEQLRPVEFNWKDSGNKSYGIIAQELEEVLPAIVATDGEGYKSVTYDALIPFLIKSIQELNQRVKELEKANGIL